MQKYKTILQKQEQVTERCTAPTIEIAQSAFGEIHENERASTVAKPTSAVLRQRLILGVAFKRDVVFLTNARLSTRTPVDLASKQQLRSIRMARHAYIALSV